MAYGSAILWQSHKSIPYKTNPFQPLLNLAELSLHAAYFIKKCGIVPPLQGATHISKEYALGLQRGLTPLGLGYKYRLFYELCPLSLYLDWSSMQSIEDWGCI
jgi:hypothetical protein